MSAFPLVAIVFQSYLDVLRKNEVAIFHTFYRYLLELCQFTKTERTTRRSAAAARTTTTTTVGRTIKNANAKRGLFVDVYFQWLTQVPNHCFVFRCELYDQILEAGVFQLIYP